MMIDCDTCAVRGAACADCVVTWLTADGAGAPRVTLTPVETRAIDVLVEARLVPPLRHEAPRPVVRRRRSSA